MPASHPLAQLALGDEGQREEVAAVSLLAVLSCGGARATRDGEGRSGKCLR
jgi:hypothetical protein